MKLKISIVRHRDPNCGNRVVRTYAWRDQDSSSSVREANWVDEVLQSLTDREGLPADAEYIRPGKPPSNDPVVYKISVDIHNIHGKTADYSFRHSHSHKCPHHVVEYGNAVLTEFKNAVIRASTKKKGGE